MPPAAAAASILTATAVTKRTRKANPDKPKKLAFTNAAVFDKKFKADIEQCFSVSAKMLFSKRINIDGSIDTNNLVNTRKYELWSYIYFLYYYNNTSIDEFSSMKNTRGGIGGASAENFYNTVRTVVTNQYINSLNPIQPKASEYIPYDPQTLAYFINYIVHKYGDNLKNPIIDFIRELLETQKPVAKLNSLIVKTNQNANTNVKIVPNSRNSSAANAAVANADVRINVRAL
jgi:hypothetical protein